MVILEELESAKKRGAHIYGEVLGTARRPTLIASPTFRPMVTARLLRCECRSPMPV